MSDARCYACGGRYPDGSFVRTDYPTRNGYRSVNLCLDCLAKHRRRQVTCLIVVALCFAAAILIAWVANRTRGF